MFDRCCFCFTPRTGGLIIGYVLLLLAKWEFFSNIKSFILSGTDENVMMEFFEYKLTGLLMAIVVNVLLLFGIYKVSTILLIINNFTSISVIS